MIKTKKKWVKFTMSNKFSYTDESMVSKGEKTRQERGEKGKWWVMAGYVGKKGWSEWVIMRICETWVKAIGGE